MDTNIADRIEIQVEDGEGSPSHVPADEGEDRLKTFRAIEAGERLTGDPQGMTPTTKSRRNGLMIGASSAAVVAAAAGVFWISPYNHYTFRDATNLATHVRDTALNAAPKPPPPIAPAAQLARAPAPTASTVHDRPTPPKLQPVAGGDDMAEFLRLGGRAAPPQPVAPVSPAPNKAVAVVANPPSVGTLPEGPAEEAKLRPIAPQRAATSKAPPPAPSAQAATPVIEAVNPMRSKSPEPAPAVHEATAPLPSKPAAPTPTASAPAVPQDAVAKITALRPAPMTDSQQLQVLQLVTELGTLVRDQRVEIAQLRQDQQNLGRRVDSSLTDFGRRLSLAEARGAVSAAMGVKTAPIQPATTAAAPVAPAASSAVVKASLPVAASADTTPHRYHVQAASPGLAMLSNLDSASGEDQQLPVAPGDTVPGWGKVVSISQRGTTWVVKTEHGLIQ
jgi:hypothetical protein